MFIGFPSIKNFKLSSNESYSNCVKVNKKGFVYGFKYIVFKDHSVVPSNFISILADSDLQELSVFFIKSQTRAASSQGYRPGLSFNSDSSLAAAVIESTNSAQSDLSRVDYQVHESLYISSNEVIPELVLKSFSDVFSKNGIELMPIDSDTIKIELKTFVEGNEKFKLKKGDFGETAIQDHIKVPLISSPLIQLHEKPETLINSDMDTSEIGYKLITACYLFKFDDEISCRWFHGIRLYSRLQEHSNRYQRINRFISDLSAKRIKYSIQTENRFLYLAMIPGVIHGNSVILKTSIKSLSETAPHNILIRNNSTKTWKFNSANQNNIGTNDLCFQTEDNSLGNIGLSSGVVTLSGLRDDPYNALILQKICSDIDDGSHVIILDQSNDLAYLPSLFGGSTYSHASSFTSALLKEVTGSNKIVSDIIAEFISSRDFDLSHLVSALNGNKVGVQELDSTPFQTFHSVFKGRLSLLRPDSVIESFLFLLLILQFSRTEKCSIIINNAENISSNTPIQKFIDAFILNGASVLVCYGSTRLFDHSQREVSKKSDLWIARKEVPIQKPDMTYQVSDIEHADSNRTSWFSLSSSNGNVIAKLPTANESTALINSAKQTMFMVSRMVASGTPAQLIYNKLKSLD